MNTATSQNYLDMSDDEVMNMTSPTESTAAPIEETSAAAPVTEPTQSDTSSLVPTEESNELSENTDNTGANSENGSSIAPEATTTVVTTTDDQGNSTTLPAGTPAQDDKGQQANAGTVAPETQTVAVNYEEFYKKIMAPFRANGKTISLQSPEEAIQLMQMGANFTRKMQDIAPHRKVLLMLENNGLLDEGKLSYLIDLDKKNPEAIKKLVKDAGIDPLDIDTSKEPAYLEGNHRVADNEVLFRNVLDELSSDPVGKETIKEIHTSWDQASKEVLWNDPQIMTTIHEQRTNGIYAVIVGEMDRQKTLGLLPAGTPFLTAYKTVGDQLAAQAATRTGGTPATGSPAGQPPVVATRVAAPKAAVTNGDKVSAASPTRSTPRKVEVAVNPLAMDDDQFLQQMKNRL